MTENSMTVVHVDNEPFTGGDSIFLAGRTLATTMCRLGARKQWAF